ncbi:hypothetical protein L226DRAFT_193396 [Lentinus tigrinus ALCF2SS1-7]|uniref:uncharacterized protein n=1 Tax=Lentinus tigrinus ALCF2SS1-7 TaxID=1328758 RepID=UPI0011663110|nr:hypothetical protein L226DRAFT_193396 [Lentinus tigrinus ALCF2SS1-7]
MYCCEMYAYNYTTALSIITCTVGGCSFVCSVSLSLSLFARPACSSCGERGSPRSRIIKVGSVGRKAKVERAGAHGKNGGDMMKRGMGWGRNECVCARCRGAKVCVCVWVEGGRSDASAKTGNDGDRGRIVRCGGWWMGGTYAERRKEEAKVCRYSKKQGSDICLSMHMAKVIGGAQISRTANNRY